MRPLLVLGLVVLSVAALLFTLFSTDSNLEVATPVGPGAVQPEITQPDNDKPASINRPKVEPVAKADRRTETVGSGRQSVGAPSEVYENAVYGRVLDPEGLPLENTSLVLTEGGVQSGMAEIQRMMGTLKNTTNKSRTTRTDEEGNYRFHNLAPGNYSLVATHDDFSKHQDPMIPVQFKGDTFWDVNMQEGLSLHGYVHSHEGGPIEGATLSMGSSMTPAMFAPAGSRKLADALTAVSDETGYYRFVNISPGKSWHISASAEDFGTQTKRNVRINAKTGTNNVDFRLSPGERIAGIVYGPDRSPIVGASIRVIGYQEPQTLNQDTESGEDGKFEIKDLVGGDYALIVSADGWGSSQRNRIKAPLTDIEIEMAEQGSVMGHVVDDRGQPLTEFTLGLHQYVAQSSTYGRRSQQKKFSSADGSFTLTGVTAGRYGVKVEAAGFANTYSEDFEVTQGLPTTDVLVEMNLGGSITGTVVDATTGKPLKGATVMTQDNNYQDNPFMRLFAQSTPRRTSENKTRTDADGNFELNMLAPELYQVQVIHPSYPSEAVNNLRVIEGDATEMGTIRLQSGGTVRGTVFDGAGEALSGATVQLISVNRNQPIHIEARTSAEGRYILRNVPAGSFKLSAASATDENNVFQPIVDMQNSEVLFNVAGGQEYTQDLNLGG